MANSWAKDRANAFYMGMAGLSVAAVLAGFSTTYFFPGVRGTLGIPWVAHVHGWLAMGWVVLLTTQVLLVRAGKTRLHRRIGWMGLPLALSIWASSVPLGRWVAARDLPEQGGFAYAAFAGTLISLTLFLTLVIAAFALRSRPDWHKRLILLATIVLLWPAYFRFRHFLPFVPRPEITLALLLADLPILVAAIRDRVRFGRVHPAWAIVGSAVFVEQVAEIAAFESGITATLGEALFALFD
ncbi:hypothetical protein H9L12_05805 [Sphingomonas rhizophila]|uniref:DUF2306 domain-containing protein n=1 Tax=Sphingomonas rhizophila TaxID=2071607 RepID=A0A7G9SDT9_9SPHN|nr:hypothetical protein [Sphingomonas rhizophila]QNN66014.1 hypothetical protein H9L12_05805 [Sphingomonas rhizophila]